MSKKILICDDELYIRLLITKNLEKYDFQILEAQDGREAVESAKETLPDLIIMDYAMPKQDGQEAIKEIKADEKTRNIPIIFLTGLNLRPDIKDALNKEVAVYLVKPFKKMELIEAIEKVLSADLPEKR